MIYFLFLAIIVLVIGLIISFRGKDDVQRFSASLTLAASFTITCLVLPYYFLYESDIVIAVLSAIRYGIISVGMNVNGDIVNELELVYPFSLIYSVLLDAMYILGPFAASLFIISSFRNLLAYFRSKRHKRIHVFSEINEKSLSICESLYNSSRNQTIIFCNADGYYASLEKKARTCKAILFKDGVSSIRLHRNKSYEFYILDENSQNTLKDTTSLCEKLIKDKRYRKEKVIVRYFLSDTSLELVRNLDQKYAKDIYLRNIDEDNALAIETLLRNRDYLSSKKHREIYLFGSNNLTKAFLNNLLCLLNQPNSSYNISIFDSDVRKMAEEILFSSPEVLNMELDNYFSPLLYKEARYNIHFYEVNENSCEFLDIYEELRRPDMVFICGDDDMENYEIAQNLKRLYAYRSEMLDYPIINCLLKDKDLNSAIVDETINTFGNYSEMYNYNNLVHPELEDAAKRAHLSYLGDDALKADKKKQEELLNESGFYIRKNNMSSFAVALGLEYHLAYIKSLNYDNEDTRTFVNEWLSDEYNMSELAIAEHERWNAYQRIQGYRCPDDEQLKKIAEKSEGRSVSDASLLLHPALVEYDKLADREKQVDEIYASYNLNKKSAYIQLDKDFLEKIFIILGHE